MSLYSTKHILSALIPITYPILFIYVSPRPCGSITCYHGSRRDAPIHGPTAVFSHAPPVFEWSQNAASWQLIWPMINSLDRRVTSFFRRVAAGGAQTVLYVHYFRRDIVYRYYPLQEGLVLVLPW